MATKRIKKVDTPIDARETFVSLQKNFADADVSVMDRLKTLYALQEADSNIDKILQLRGELPEEVEALEEKIESLKAKQAQEEAVIAAYNDTIAQNRQNIIECDAQIEKYQKQLETISNSREYDSINKEIENQGLLRQIAQKSINDTKIAIAAKRDDIEDLKHRLLVDEDDLVAKKEELGTIVEYSNGLFLGTKSTGRKTTSEERPFPPVRLTALLPSGENFQTSNSSQSRTASSSPTH